MRAMKNFDFDQVQVLDPTTGEIWEWRDAADDMLRARRRELKEARDLAKITRDVQEAREQPYRALDTDVVETAIQLACILIALVAILHGGLTG